MTREKAAFYMTYQQRAKTVYFLLGPHLCSATTTANVWTWTFGRLSKVSVLPCLK